MNDVEIVQPAYLDVDTSLLLLKPGASPYLRGYRLAWGRNKSGKMGGNFGKGKKMQSNWHLVDLNLPAGINKVCGFYEQEILNEAYVFLWNSNNNHSIQVIYGNSLTTDTVYIGPLPFTIDPKNYLAQHRIYVRLIYDVYNDEERHVREKILTFTNGFGWQGWINMLSSIATKSYNVTQFPYYKLQPPHFDVNEFWQYPVRPPMYAPVINLLPRTADDLGKQNRILNQTTYFAYDYVLTDGRSSNFSPWSNPLFVGRSPCSSIKSLSRSADLALYAGSAHVEMIRIFVRTCDSDWLLYDTIYKFTSDGDNAPQLIGDQYWTRTNPWSSFQYDAVNNLIHYTYSGDKQAIPFSKTDATDFQNDVPIKSMAMTPAGDALLMMNNLRFYNNLPTETLNKFDIQVLPAQTKGCTVKNVKISVYAYMARNGEIGQVVYQNGTTGTTLFGGLENMIDSGKTDSVDKVVSFFNYTFLNLTSFDSGLSVGQQQKDLLNGNPLYNIEQIAISASESNYFGLNFGPNQNFICYLAGTPYAAIGEQYICDANGNLTKIGIIDATNNEQILLIQNTYLTNGFFVQKFDFFVPAGKYIARLARHDSSLGSNYATTSTYVQGIMNHKYIMNGKGQFYRNPMTVVGSASKDMFIDASNGDVDMWNSTYDLFMVFVPYIFKASGNFGFLDSQKWRFIEGYVWEDLDTKNPIEFLGYVANKGDVQWKRQGNITDHNGFFFSYSRHDKITDTITDEVVFTGYWKCRFNTTLFTTSIDVTNNHDNGWYPNQNITIKDHYSAAEAINTRIIIQGKILNCDTGEGIPAVGITIENGPTYFTDGDGSFTYFAREGNLATRHAQLLFNTGGSCLFTSCACGPVASVVFDTSGLPCTPNAPRNAPNVNTMLKLVVIDQRGLKKGGTFGFSVKVLDAAGRTSAEQDIKSIDIPTFMETGIFAPNAIQWLINGPLNLDPTFTQLIFSRTTNRNAKSYVQWVGDKITFIDNKGNTVIDGNGAIRAKVTLQSLLDFNVLNNFNTNVNYQFNQGDILRIMDDGENNLFKPDNETGFMDYLILGTDYNQTVADLGLSNVTTVTNETSVDHSGNVTTTKSTSQVNPNSENDGVSVVIEFDERLLQLLDGNVSKTGFWVEIITPKDIAQVEPYSEIVGTVDLIGGEPVVSTGIFDTFDTYYQARQIRIPNDLGKTQLHPFESPSVTDYVKLKCTSDGRTNVKDPLVKQVWYEDEVAKSDDVINEGRVNGLGRMRTVNTKNFKGQSFGGIVAAHAERNRLVIICERDWLVCDIDLDYVRATAQGQLLVNLDKGLSDPYPKEGSVFGCSYEDVATIVFADGMGVWLDSFNFGIIALDFHHTNGQVAANFRNAVNIANEDVQSYLINKLTYVNRYNNSLPADKYLTNLIEKVGGIDPQTGEYNLTFRPRMGLSVDPQYFVNDEREIFFDQAETLIYNPDFKKWMGFAGYAPEFYGTLNNCITGQELITFFAGQPWFHNSVGKTGVLNYYGVQTGQVIEMAFNSDDKMVKIFQAAIVESTDVKYFIDRIRTEDPRFFSYAPLAYFKKKEKFFTSSILQNMGSYPDPNARVESLLADGGRTYGKVAIMRFVADINTLDQYAEVKGFGYKVAESERGETK